MTLGRLINKWTIGGFLLLCSFGAGVWVGNKPTTKPETVVEEKVVYVDRVVEVAVDRIVNRVIEKRADGTEVTKEEVVEKSKEKVVEKSSASSVVKVETPRNMRVSISLLPEVKSVGVEYRLMGPVWGGIEYSPKDKSVAATFSYEF